ncbi:hypothetical protein [Vibrio hippocampi]|uniref:DUF2281 domain-containing protein n=1 Tax=Vibrio hippocampi TaxID=654686 RepID=A0ABM8ZNC6_9VIBR|nr:hypothetical protein [Vibrio hippocampi]CAH0530089.1 hypothetical protein VHP8226_03817 [Vibrio hippocampi]
MNQTLEKDIVDAIHHLNQEQLLDVKKYVEQLRTSRSTNALIEDDELDMLLKLMATETDYR